jgi:microcystin-dependent protein
MKLNVTCSMLLFLIWEIGFSQSTLITPGNNQPSIIATSTNSGVLIPKVSLTSNLASPSPLSSPQEGTLVYNNGANQTHGFYFWTGSAWSSLGIAISSLTATAPITIQSNTVKLNAGTAVGQLITWDGANWVNTSPKNPASISNIQPYLALNYSIALYGIFPSRNSADPFVGEIGLFGFSFPPKNWALCNGQLLPINTNQALFSLLGTNYGGNGTTNFALPNLQSRVPIHFGQGPGLSLYNLGQTGGTETNIINDKY